MPKLTQRIGLSRFEADEHYKIALAEFQKGNFDQAIDNMNKAIELLPTNPEYHATRGLIYLQDGINDKAQDNFEAALKIYSFEMLAHYGRGIIAYKDKNWDEARAHFNSALAADPDRPETLYYVALVHHRQRENQVALAMMQQAEARFEETGDRKRKNNAGRWVRELEKLLRE